LIKEAKAARAIRLRDEAQTLKEHNTYLEKEKSELEFNMTDLAASVKVREQEVADLDVVVTSVKLQNNSLADQVHKLEVAYFGFQEKLSHYEILTERLEEFQDAQLKVANDKLEKLYADFCLHSSEYLSALEAAIGKAIEKGMQDGLAVRITHGVEELRSNKDASVDTIMNILRLEDNLAERVVVGATSLSFSLDVSDARVRKIRENIASQRLALRDVFTPIYEPFSAEVLTGTRGTSDIVHAPITTALSVTFIFTSTIPPISTDDYEIAHTEGGEDAIANVEAIADEGADPFPDVSGAELDVSE
nr:hypothetical protein [Tanacetum cinerariifolium]